MISNHGVLLVNNNYVMKNQMIVINIMIDSWKNVTNPMKPMKPMKPSNNFCFFTQLY